MKTKNRLYRLSFLIALCFLTTYSGLAQELDLKSFYKKVDSILIERPNKPAILEIRHH